MLLWETTPVVPGYLRLLLTQDTASDGDTLGGEWIVIS